MPDQANLDPAAVRRAFERIPAPDLGEIADRIAAHIRRGALLDRERRGMG